MKEKKTELLNEFEDMMSAMLKLDDKEQKSFNVYEDYIDRGYSEEEAQKMAELEMLK